MGAFVLLLVLVLGLCIVLVSEVGHADENRAE